MHWVNDSIKLTSLGNIQTLFICTLAIWIPSSTLQYLLCSFYGWMWSCGHFIFVSFFGGEALVLSLSLYHYQITGEFWIDSTAWDFYSLYRLLRKFKRKSSFRFVGKWKLFIVKLFFEEFNLLFFTAEHLAWFEMQPRQRRFGAFIWGTFLLCGQGNLVFKRRFMYL